MVRNKRLYQKAKVLRENGKSYSEINKALHLAKSTISVWFSDQKWSRSIKMQLIERHKGEARNQLIRLNLLKRIKTLERHKGYREEAELEYERIKNNYLFVVGLSIYWGEGEKGEKGRVSVVNTDSDMLQVVVNFYRKILKVPESKLRVALFLYKDINERKALNFWSRKVKIPKSQFIKTQKLQSRSVLTRRRSINGICNVYFCDTKLNIKINEWIKLLASEMRV